MRSIYAYGAISMIIGSIFMLLLLQNCNKNDTIAPSSSPMGIGGPDDPVSRDQYLFDLYKSPSGTIPDNIREKELAFATTLPVRSAGRSETWYLRGPRNVGGRTRAVAIDVTDESKYWRGRLREVCGGLMTGAHHGAKRQPLCNCIP